MLNTPILLMIFNRPDSTEKVFAQVKQQRPRSLFIAADGPRLNNLADIDLCLRSREIVANIDWDCEVKTLYREENLGCGAAPAQAISWFFEHVEQGIILEDDILPDPSFFGFCETLLDRFKNDLAVMHISGCYFLDDFTKKETPFWGYYFTKHIHVWGWATWRRAWRLYDYEMKDRLSRINDRALTGYYGDYAPFWKNTFKGLVYERNDIWDYQWMFAIYKNNGIAINPTVNLTTNIGFDHNATHTKDTNSIFTTVKRSSLLSITDPVQTTVDFTRDSLYYKHFLNFDPKLQRSRESVIWKLKNYLKKSIAGFRALWR